LRKIDNAPHLPGNGGKGDQRGEGKIHILSRKLPAKVGKQRYFAASIAGRTKVAEGQKRLSGRNQKGEKSRRLKYAI